MKLKIAAPINPLFNPLLENEIKAHELFDFELFRLEETKCIDLFMANRLDCALLSPLGYGMGVVKGDFRIIPNPCLSTLGYTSIASLYFRKGLKNVTSCASPTPDDFMMIIGRLLFGELFGWDFEIEKIKGNSDELLEKCESAMVWESNLRNSPALDISEEWNMAYLLPLPLGLWVCRSELEYNDIEALLKSLSSANLPERVTIIDRDKDTAGAEPRNGSLLFNYTDDVANGLVESIQLLYLRGLLPEIPAVKLYGDDQTNLPEN